MAMPAAAWRSTISCTALATRSASAASSTGMPSPFAHMMRIRSSGRGRLPVWVVSMRSAPVLIVSSPSRLGAQLGRGLRHGRQLAEGGRAAEVLHAAVGREQDALGVDVFQCPADPLLDRLYRLHLVRGKVQNAEQDLLVRQ